MTPGAHVPTMSHHKYFLQYSRFASETPQVRTLGTPNLLVDPGAISPRYASADSDKYLLACNAAVRTDPSFLVA